jgi:hypothetical protein
MPAKAPKRKMATTKLTMVIERDLIAAIDAFRSEQPGITPSRSQTIRSLLWWSTRNFPKRTPLPKVEE